jgi:hypothetical protein
MAIEMTVHDRNPAVLAEMIQLHIGDASRDPLLSAQFQVLLDKEERENERRRAAWHWLNSISTGIVDRDNDWSDL